MTESQKTTLTREGLLAKAKPRYETVDVDGWGIVGIREQSILRGAVRASQMFDDNGKLIPERFKYRNANTIVDQLMIDETTPMFSESDVPILADLSLTKLSPLLAAIQRFNEEIDPGKKDESSESHES